MIKHVSGDRCEGIGIIKRIEGNGWDIDAERIELNGIIAYSIEDLENRIISLDGPAVEDLFKSLRDLLKENGELRMDIDDKEKENIGLRRYIDNIKNPNESVNYCDNDVLITEILYLRRTIEEQDEFMKRLANGLKDKEAAIRALQETVKEKNECIKRLNKKTLDKNIEIDILNSKLIEKCDNKSREKCRVLENKLTVADRLNPILDFISGAADDKANFAIKTFLHFIPDYDVTVSVSRKEEKDVEINKPEKYDSTKEILGWLRGMIENDTDYATKIFNKESKEDIFSITFCKVPVEPEGVNNE